MTEHTLLLVFLALGLGFTFLNLVILGLNLKLYTEVLKDKSMDARKAGVLGLTHSPPPSPSKPGS